MKQKLPMAQPQSAVTRKSASSASNKVHTVRRSLRRSGNSTEEFDAKFPELASYLKRMDAKYGTTKSGS